MLVDTASKRNNSASTHWKKALFDVGSYLNRARSAHILPPEKVSKSNNNSQVNQRDNSHQCRPGSRKAVPDNV